jgi:iron complex transport system substrate-binding protein
MCRNVYLILLILVIWGCKNRTAPDRDSSIASQDIRKVPVSYATGFDIKYYGGYTLLTVRDPWQQADNIEFKYALTMDGNAGCPAGYELIEIPVKRVICLSTTHIGFIGFLGQEESVVGISGKNYINDEYINRHIETGQIKDIGFDESLNYELIVELNPDIVFLYGVTGAVASYINKLKELDIKTVMVGEYLEETPLAKMEWVKFIAAFYNAEQKAISMFDSVSQNYNRLVSLAANVPERPKVLLGLPWHGTWYISGSRSYAARIIKDAGGEYLWSGLDYRDSQPLGLESVFEKAFTADFWLNTGEVNSISDIIKADTRFSELPPVSSGRVFNNNNIMNSFGANDYFEKGVVEPDIILSDIIRILHPEILPGHKLKYYRQMN